MKKQHAYSSGPKNRKTFLSFLLLYVVISAGAVMPLLRAFSYLVLEASGFRYLTAENIWQLLRHPLVYLALPAAGILYGGFELMEISGLIFIRDRSCRGQHVSLPETALFVFRNVRGVFSSHYRGFLLAALVISPAYQLSSVVNLLNSYSSFALFMRTMRRNWYLRITFITGAVLLFILFFRWFYVFHYYTLEGYSFRQAVKRSRSMLKRQKKRRIAAVLGILILAVIGYMLINLAGIALIGLGKQMGFSGSAVSSVQVTYMSICGRLFDTLVVPLLFFSIGNLFMEGKAAIGEPFIYADKMDLSDEQARRLKKLARHFLPRGRRLELGIFAVSIAVFAFYIQSSARKQFRLRIEYLGTVEVSAHRGASMHYPENTLAAFAGAVEQGADWIELDVQESRDGQIFVMHDESLKRTTGVDRKSWELDYEELRELDAGSFFNEEYADQYLPLLSEVVAFAKENDIRLNIELKPNGHEQNLVDGVLDVVEEAGFENSCVITSQKYDVLRQVKERNEDIYTVYVMGLAYGAINRLKAADAFSIRSTSITQSLVTDLHNRGLEVYAWTVDSRANINRMINLGVDNIITNNIPLAVECINTSRTESILGELLRMLTDRFR